MRIKRIVRNQLTSTMQVFFQKHNVRCYCALLIIIDHDNNTNKNDDNNINNSDVIMNMKNKRDTIINKLMPLP